jgi:N-acyl homoserine lactone hydrolase
MNLSIHSLLAAALVLLSCASLPALAPSPFVPAPPATTPLEVCWLETGGTQTPGSYGASGRTTADVWEVTTSALLVRHPKGDLLIDSGLSPDAAEEAKELGSWRRFVFGQTAARNVTRGLLRTQLEGLNATGLKAIVISHAHADHMGGVAQLPGVPVWLAPEEVAFIEADQKSQRGVVMPAQARATEGRRVALGFASGPYLNYPKSEDVFGDGSVVIVPTFGHTPGSVATFVNLPGKRIFHVGDLINLAESITRQVPKGKLMRALTDEDAHATDTEVARLVELHRAAPDLQILPAHDRAEWERLFGPTPIGSAPPCVQ